MMFVLKYQPLSSFSASQEYTKILIVSRHHFIFFFFKPRTRPFPMAASKNPFDKFLREVKVGDKIYRYYSIPELKDERAGKKLIKLVVLPLLAKLPFSIRVLLESALRSCDNEKVPQSDVETILNWRMDNNNIVMQNMLKFSDKTQKESIEVQFKPSRVILQVSAPRNNFTFNFL
jgi:hypothetical protein